MAEEMDAEELVGGVEEVVGGVEEQVRFNCFTIYKYNFHIESDK